jgi:hypothetical protein
MKSGIPLDPFEIMARLKDSSLEQLLSDYIPDQSSAPE